MIRRHPSLGGRRGGGGHHLAADKEAFRNLLGKDDLAKLKPREENVERDQNSVI